MIDYPKCFSLRLLTLIWLVFTPVAVTSQVLPDLGSNGVEQLTDSELLDYWSQVKERGYTMEQIKSVALLKGYSQSDILKLEERIRGLELQGSGMLSNLDTNSLGIVNQDPFGFDGTQGVTDTVNSKIFGYDFFNNPNITFTPNLNLATPSSYVLGPGDELVINLWGAAEQTYEREISREGAIRIDGVGPIYLGGIDITAAKVIIQQKLRKIYAGLSAPNGSPYKVNLDISLANIRSVQVDIIGEVKVPGTYTLSALSTVLNGLYASGGPTTFGTFRNIKLVRGGETVGVFDVYDYLLNGSQNGNLTLKDRDVIIVSPHVSRIQVSGAVKREGIFELLPDENMLDLLRYTSGFKSNAYRDLIVLERIEGDRKVIREIDFNNASLISLKDGDAIVVRNTVDKFVNKVTIEGAVYRAGKYELTPGLKLSDLIEKAAGVKSEAFLERGIVLRTEDGVQQRVESFSVQEVLDGTADIDLKPDDLVRIYDNYSLTENSTLTIDGAVNNPSEFKYIEDMTVEDLVIMAGGFRDGANPNVIDIFRKINDDEFETLSKNFKVTASGSLTTVSGEPFYLMPNDKVSVRYLRGAGEVVRAAVLGEVNYPGTYSNETKGEKISDLIERAGGLSPYAYPEGATLIRLNPFFKGGGQDVTLDELTENLSNEDSIDLNNRRAFRVGIDLVEILKEKKGDSKYDLIIQNGDRIVIPSKLETVKIEGEILLPSLVRFDVNYSLLDYIDRSGGFSEQAKRGKTYVVYNNGEIATTKRFLFFKSYPKLKPGALILVPSKQRNLNRLSAQEVLGIGSGLATFGLIVDRLFR